MLEIMRENASGWIVKILFGIIIVVFVFAFGMSGFDSGQDPVMATVNGQVITRAEFEDTFQRAAENMRQANPNITAKQLQSTQFKQAVLNELISNRLLLAEAERLGISASDKEVFAAITRLSSFWNKDGQFDPAIYQSAMRSIRMTPSQFEASFKKELIASKVRDLVKKTGEATEAQARQVYDWIGEEIRIDYILASPEQYVDAVTVSDEQIGKFYADHEKDFMVPDQIILHYLIFTPEELAPYQEVSDEEIAQYFAANKDSMRQEEQVNASHILILVKDDADEAAQKAAKDKIDQVYAKAAKGEDFAALAKEYSEGPSSVSGGALGWFGWGAMVPEFEEAAFATQQGEVSKPFKTQFGWHILKVTGHKDAKAKELAEVKDEIKSVLAQEKASEQVTNLLDQAMDRLVSGMKVDELGKELGITPVTSGKLQERALPPTFGLTPEAAKVLMDLPAGTVHQTPLSVNGGYMIAQKVEDIEAAPLPLQEVRLNIINAIKREKAIEMAKAEAEEILEKVQSGSEGEAAFAARVTTSDTFGRQGGVPELGASPELAEAVFAAKDNTWLPKVFPTQRGMVVARLNERIPASESTWKEQKELWVRQTSQTYEQEAVLAYMNGLRESAVISIARPDLLN